MSWHRSGFPAGTPSQQLCCLYNSTVVSCSWRDEPRIQTVVSQAGCTFESGHGGHLIVRLGTRMSVLPMHGKQKELGTGLVKRIKRDLGLK